MGGRPFAAPGVSRVSSGVEGCVVSLFYFSYQAHSFFGQTTSRARNCLKIRSFHRSVDALFTFLRRRSSSQSSAQADAEEEGRQIRSKADHPLYRRPPQITRCSRRPCSHFPRADCVDVPTYSGLGTHRRYHLNPCSRYQRPADVRETTRPPFSRFTSPGPRPRHARHLARQLPHSVSGAPDSATFFCLILFCRPPRRSLPRAFPFRLFLICSAASAPPADVPLPRHPFPLHHSLLLSQAQAERSPSPSTSFASGFLPPHPRSRAQITSDLADKQDELKEFELQLAIAQKKGEVRRLQRAYERAKEEEAEKEARREEGKKSEEDVREEKRVK